MGFHSPPKCRGLGVRIQLRPPLPLPTCAPSRAGEEVQGRVRVGAGDKKAAVGPQEIRTERPRGRNGCKRAGRGAARKPKGGRWGEGAARPGTLPGTTPGGQGGGGRVPWARRRQNLLRGPPPRGSRGRRPGLPAGSPGPGAPGEKMELGRHKGKH